MTPEDNSTIRNVIRVAAIAPPVLMGLGSLIFGIVMFFRIGASERDFNAKMESIRAGKAAPETLTVIDKYINPSRHGSGYPHVICRGNHNPRVNLSVTRQFYDSVAAGSPVAAYYFPDGYFVPQSRGDDAGLAKWLFLGTGFTMGGLMLAFGLSQSRRISADSGQLGALIKARIDMAKRNQ